ncbi:MAG: NAD-dependent succinate-semialdehyde dehydrogenase [Verrucomicrobiota bacterium]
MAIATINPATGERVKEFAPSSRGEVEKALARGAAAFGEFSRTSFQERADSLSHVADILERDRERLARLITLEMGKLLREAKAEIDKCAGGCRYYAANADKLLHEENVATNIGRSAIRYEPLGLVLAIMPWNFPFWQVCRFAAPALMAGNVCLLKHAANVPQCALALAEIFSQSGFPEGVFQTLLLENEGVEEVIRDERVRAVTLTGSDRAGSAVASIAGRELKKCVLELGGSDPFIVRPSADLKAAVETAIKARTINAGQSCIAAKRFIVAEEVYDDFAQRLVAGMRALQMGDPLEEATGVAPLASAKIRESLEKQVQQSVAAGAKILTGGRRPERAGYFYEPTVLAEIPSGAPAYHEEVFGPVALLFRARDSGEAVRLANASHFGLGASVWTRDAAEQEFFTREIEAGMVFVNTMVLSTPELPFGGVKRSGYGRELGAEGIREFTNIKTVCFGV